MTDDIEPRDLTSPGTVSDPALEEERAREAALREQESRARSETGYEAELHAEEARRHELAERLKSERLSEE